MTDILSPIATNACGFVTEWKSGTRLIDSALLNVMANKFLRDLALHASTIDQFSRDSGSALAAATADFRVAFASTGKDNCIDIDPSIRMITVNRDFFDGIAGRALQVNWPRNIRRAVVVRRMVRVNARAIVRMVVGHELFHAEQGLPTIGALRQAAATVGWDEIARFDVDADVRAAAIEATLSAIEDGNVSYANVLRRFEEALAFQLRYCAPIFGAPANKAHKRSRLAALAMQLARVVYANRTQQPLDSAAFASLAMPTYVRFNAEYSCIAIVGMDPVVYLGSGHFEMGELKEFFNALDSGRVEWLVQEAITLWMRIGLLPA